MLKVTYKHGRFWGNPFWNSDILCSSAYTWGNMSGYLGNLQKKGEYQLIAIC